MSININLRPSDEYKIQRLNLLSFPRNLSPKCEVTGDKATVELVTQHITLFYVSEELAEQAWLGIIRKISHLLPPLLQPPPIIGTQEERVKRINNINISKKSLIDFCLLESSNLLSVHKYQLAFPAAFQAVKFTKELDGEKSLTLVEPLLQLSQCCLGMKQFNKAEEYLSLARWIILSDTNCEDKVRARMHMLKGRICIAQGLFDAAKPDFADSVYYSSRYFGAESIVSSIGYYRLGDVFLAQGNVECSLAFFDKVVDIWYKYLSQLNQSPIIHLAIPAPTNPSEMQIVPIVESLVTEQLTEENLAEGRSQLEIIFDHRKRLLGNSHIATGEVQYTLGLYEFFLLGNESMAESFVLSALHAYEMQLGANHPSCKHVTMMLALIQQSISDKMQSAIPPLL